MLERSNKLWLSSLFLPASLKKSSSSCCKRPPAPEALWASGLRKRELISDYYCGHQAWEKENWFLILIVDIRPEKKKIDFWLLLWASGLRKRELISNSCCGHQAWEKENWFLMTGTGKRITCFREDRNFWNQRGFEVSGTFVCYGRSPGIVFGPLKIFWNGLGSVFESLSWEVAQSRDPKTSGKKEFCDISFRNVVHKWTFLSPTRNTSCKSKNYFRVRDDLSLQTGNIKDVTIQKLT